MVFPCFLTAGRTRAFILKTPPAVADLFASGFLVLSHKFMTQVDCHPEVEILTLIILYRRL